MAKATSKKPAKPEETDDQANDGLSNFYFPDHDRTVRAESYEVALEQLNAKDEKASDTDEGDTSGEEEAKA